MQESSGSMIRILKLVTYLLMSNQIFFYTTDFVETHYKLT